MKSTPVFAVADSRLHADVMLIRLRRAGISCSQISALFPRRSVPNAVACWLSFHKNMVVKVGREIFAAAGRVPGFLKSLTAPSADISEVLTSSGVDRVNAHRIEAKMNQGHTLLTVTARNEDEASVAWHVFKHSGAETIIVAGEDFSSDHGDVSAASTTWAVAA